MKILVVAATISELNPFNRLQLPEKHKVYKRVLGVGMLATTYHLLQCIESDKPDLLVQMGIAGTFSNDAPLGSSFVVETEYIADSGVEENGSFLSLFDLKLMDDNEAPFTNRQLKNPHEMLLQKTNLKLASSITVSEISTSHERINHYKKQFNPKIESMEGAAFHYCCLMKNIPFVQIRATSNYVGERNKNNWRMDTALQSVASSTHTFISNM